MEQRYFNSTNARQLAAAARARNLWRLQTVGWISNRPKSATTLALQPNDFKACPRKALQRLFQMLWELQYHLKCLPATNR